MRAAEEEEETAEREKREEQVAKERGVVALLVPFRDGDVDAVLGEDVDELGVVRQGHLRAPAVNRGELERGAILREAHAFNLAAHDGADELGVPPGVALGEGVGVRHLGVGRGEGIAGHGGLRLRLKLGERRCGGGCGGGCEIVGDRGEGRGREEGGDGRDRDGLVLWVNGVGRFGQRLRPCARNASRITPDLARHHEKRICATSCGFAAIGRGRNDAGASDASAASTRSMRIV